MHKTDHIYRINEILNLIHSDISADLPVKTLAKHAAFSEQYFHRLFKKVTGEPAHQYIRRTRLEAAANQLIFSPQLTVQVIAEECGFSSLSSFNKAFKSVYKTTPGEWRSRKKYAGKKHYLSDPELKEAFDRLIDAPLPEPDIVNLDPFEVAYIRHKGYGRLIRKSWQLLQAWAISEKRPFTQQIGLHHSNPAIVPLDQCQYVACIKIEKPVIRRGQINSATIPGGLHAAFHFQGKYGELLPRISKIQEEWLPNSSYIARTTPTLALYKKNQFLNNDDRFDLVFYLPISLKLGWS
ncbi:MAG: AraC family transcriptional regulator [Arenicella sp.]